MIEELGGVFWFIVDVVLVAILAAAIVYGTMQWRNRRRSPAQDNATERAVRDHYEKPGRNQ